MIITLSGADFSASNIGVLAMWRVTTSLGSGVTYDGPDYVEKGAPLKATLTIADNYTLDNVSVLVGASSVPGAYTINGNKVTISLAEVTDNVTISVATTRNMVVTSYVGAEEFKNVGCRVQTSTTAALGWVSTVSGTTSWGTDLIEVDSDCQVWLQYVAVVNDQLGSGGFFDANKNLVAPLYWGTFGVDQAATATKKFVTPETPVSIADVEAEWGATIKYVRFDAWGSSAGGQANTEAKVYRPA